MSFFFPPVAPVLQTTPFAPIPQATPLAPLQVPTPPVDTQTIVRPFQLLLANFIQSLPSLIAAVVIIILTFWAAALVGRAVKGSLRFRSASDQATLLLTKISRWTVLILGFMVALQQVGFNLTAFLTGLGIAGFTIGFAIQDISKNFIAGVILLIQQPFSVGDAIMVTNIGGVVKVIDLRATELHTWDGQVVLIPNATFLTNPITNFSRATHRRVEIPIGVDYGSDMEAVRRVALEAVQGIDGRLDDPAPQILFQGYGDSTMNLSVFYWIDTTKADPMQARDAGLLLIYAAFTKAGINMPYPTQILLTPGQGPNHTPQAPAPKPGQPAQ
jgi:small conductance mechanosensitive channel